MSEEGLKIKEQIDANNEMIEAAFCDNRFVLNPVIFKLKEENKELQKKCPHEFDHGYCIYCYKREKKESQE